VFYDTQDHRAWLSNGLHTLLHLVRASLKEDQRGDFSDECLLNSSELEEDVITGGANPKSAIKFLKNRMNLEQPLFPGLDEIRTEYTAVAGGQASTTHYRTSTTVRLKDRVSQIMDILWQLIDHQATLGVLTSEVPIRLPRSKLEGYRFMEVATRRAMTPRVTYLRAFGGAGKSWVDFIRTIRAVILFGEGFGNLLTPHQAKPMDSLQSTSVCGRWKAVPKGRDYLAVSGYDLARILRQEGSAMSSPVKLAPGIFWNPSTTAFECCACDDPVNKGKSQVDIILRLAHLRRPCDRVQVLLPSIQAIVAREDAAAMGSIDINSAFIFGRSELFPWKWPDEGDPKQEDLNEASVSSSGVGVNFLTTASTSSTRSPSTSGQSRVEASSTPPTTSLSPPSSQREVGDPAALVWPDGGRTATRPSRVLRKLWRTIGRP
jgi:hypothetical protein